MAQPTPARPSDPLDVLQSMINAVLIETGKALKGANKEGGKAQAGITRPQSTIPGTIERFQQVLDELEIDILRSKSVFQRDLEECRAKRIALENPTPVAEKAPEPKPGPKAILPPTIANRAPNQPTTFPKPPQTSQFSKSPEIKKEVVQRSPEAVRAAVKPPQQTLEPPKETGVKPPEPTKPTPKPAQMPSPQPSTQEPGDNIAIGLGINTESKPNDPPTTTLQDSTIDSLFDIPDNDDTNIEMDYENMDFSFAIDTNDDQTQTQTQSNDFDLSTFGNISQDQNITSAGAGGASKDVKTDSTKPLDATFNLADIGGEDNMDLDLSMFGAADSTFDDMFIDGGDNGGGEMEHGNFDSDFFGIGN